MTTALVIPTTLPVVPAELLAGARALLNAAEDVEIDCNEMRQTADLDVAKLKVMRKAAETKRKDDKEPYLLAGRAVDELYNPVIEIVDSAISMNTQKILGYDRIVAAERARLQAESEKKAAEECQALHNEAKKLEAAGMHKAAIAVAEAATMVVAPTIAIGPAKSEQFTNKVVTWSAELKSLQDLVLAVATGAVEIEYIQFNQTYANAQARAKKKVELAPGVVGVPEENLRGKRAA